MTSLIMHRNLHYYTQKSSQASLEDTVQRFKEQRRDGVKTEDYIDYSLLPLAIDTSLKEIRH